MRQAVHSISPAERQILRARSRANATVKSRESKQRGRLTTDPGVSDRLYGDAEFEFLMAVKGYQEKTGVRFLTHCELFAILLSLGYRKS